MAEILPDGSFSGYEGICQRCGKSIRTNIQGNPIDDKHNCDLKISILFTRKDSVYKTLCDDVWDIERDARNWPGGNSIVAHPPCRMWGQLRKFAKPLPDEKNLAIQSIKWIREFGGVLEHPKSSLLWEEMLLPYPGEIDEWGGYSICVDQFWWGHRAKKSTLLYIVGCDKKDLPAIPIKFDRIEYVVRFSKKNSANKKEITKRERDATPIDFAKWLIEVAKKCKL